MLHELKIKNYFLADIVWGIKTFEIRKDDRNFKVGDIISFIPEKKFTDNVYRCKITYKLNFFDFPDGLKENYCILGIEKERGWI